MTYVFTTSFLALLTIGAFIAMVASTIEGDRWFVKMYLVLTLVFAAATVLNGRL